MASLFLLEDAADSNLSGGDSSMSKVVALEMFLKFALSRPIQNYGLFWIDIQQQIFGCWMLEHIYILREDKKWPFVALEGRTFASPSGIGASGYQRQRLTFLEVLVM